MEELVHKPEGFLSSIVKLIWLFTHDFQGLQVYLLLNITIDKGRRSIILPYRPAEHFSAQNLEKLPNEFWNQPLLHIFTIPETTEHRLWREEDGSFVHGEFHIGDSMIMIGDVKDRFDPFPGMLYVYVPDVDVTYKKAMSEGATSVEEPADQEYGDRRAAFSDPAGNKWYVASKQAMGG